MDGDTLPRFLTRGCSPSKTNIPHRGVAEWQTRVPQEHVGFARAGSSPAAPTKTLNQAIRTGGLFHAEKRPARGKTMPRTGRKWREHGPGDHARRD